MSTHSQLSFPKDIDSINQFDRQKILDTLSELELEISNESLRIITYDDIKMYHALLDYMYAYDIYFVENKFIPFLKEHNPITLKVLEIFVYFYALVIYDVLIEIVSEEHLFYHVKKKFDKTKLGNVTLFDFCFAILAELGNSVDRELCPCGLDFYMDRDTYLLIEQKFINNYTDSSFKRVMDRILGSYRLWYSCSNYLTEYQPMSLKVINHYWHILQKSQNTNKSWHVCDFFVRT